MIVLRLTFIGLSPTSGAGSQAYPFTATWQDMGKDTLQVSARGINFAARGYCEVRQSPGCTSASRQSTLKFAGNSAPGANDPFETVATDSYWDVE